MKQVNKYVAFKNTGEKLFYFHKHQDAMGFKIGQEEMLGESWTIASVDPITPSWFRKMWLWLESKMRCYE